MIDVRPGRIDVQQVVDAVRRDDAGAIVAFLGTVRADPGVGVLHYEVYRPMAVKTLRDLAGIARSKFGILDVAIVHRIGRVPVGFDSVVIACAGAHRAEAFAACAWLMDEIKRVVPIWKTEASRGHPASGRKRRRAPPK